jgi:hypothetical protein
MEEPLHIVTHTETEWNNKKRRDSVVKGMITKIFLKALLVLVIINVLAFYLFGFEKGFIVLPISFLIFVIYTFIRSFFIPHSRDIDLNQINRRASKHKFENNKSNNKKNNSWLWIVLALIILGFIFYPQIKDRVEMKIWADLPTTNPVDNSPKTVVCTADAKQCPDGSYVSRVAPSCEFATCPVIVPPVIICSTNTDCGTDGFLEEKFCKNDSLYQNFKTFNCLNSKTPASSCSSAVEEKLIESCEYGCDNSNVCLPPYSVEGTKTEVVIQNNLAEDISLNVTYRIYSNWFGKDSTESQVFEVSANSKETFKVYYNDGCSSSPCSVSILKEERI